MSQQQFDIRNFNLYISDSETIRAANRKATRYNCYCYVQTYDVLFFILYITVGPVLIA